MARNAPEGAPRARSSPKNVALYLGGLRMLKQKPPAVICRGSASRLEHEMGFGSMSPGVMAQWSTECVVPGAGACSGMDPLLQLGP